MTKIDIENTHARLFVGPPLEDGREMRLLPGINHVDADVWNRSKDMGSVPSWLKMGFIKEHGATPDAASVEIPETFDMAELLAEVSGMTAPEAVAVIEKLDAEHLPLLEAIADRDNREAVKVAAKLRIDTLKA